MTIKKEIHNDVIIYILEGEIDINTSSDLRKTFDDIVSTSNVKILIDFSSVSFIDSSGLATLIEILQKLKKTGGKLRFSNLNEKIKDIFEITKLTKIFQIFDTRQEALEVF